MTLLLHTSSERIFLGISDAEFVLAHEEFPVGRDLAATLANRIRQFLEAHSYQLSAISSIVIHTGPGGFTGLRIGVTTANSFAYALGIPVIGVHGVVAGLEGLLERSRGMSPAPSNLVVPAYGQGPRLGPIPS